jgi:hypothetical protein
VNVRIEALGESPLIAEFDAEEKTIRVNARMVERVRSRFGEGAALALIACAIAHERYHAEHPGCSEEAAHTFARAQTHDDPRMFEQMLRA